MSDARFEDAGEAPLRLRAESVEDLRVISALLQDAVLPAAEIRWSRQRMQFAALVNRFRWEDRERAEAEGRPFERVRALVSVFGALHVASEGVDPKDRDLILSVLAVEFTPADAPPGGTLRLILAGDGEIVIEVECLDVTLEDVTRPYVAPSGKAPRHPGT